MTVTSLLDFILNLLRDPQAQAQFRANPEQTLAAHGLTGVCAGDIRDALPLVTDHRAVELGGGHGAVASGTPPPVAPTPGESETHAAIRYLTYLTNTYTYTDNHSTTIDDSVHQNIWANGDVNQTFDQSNVVASGQGAVAAGGSIDGTVTTGQGDAVGAGAAAGSGNVTGSGNALGAGSAAGTGNAVANGNGSTIGTGNTVANGAGSAAGTGNELANGSHSVLGDGNVQGTVSNSQVATTGGSASSDSSNHSVNDSGNTDLHSYGAGATNTIGNGNTSSTATNSGNTSDSHSVTDSGNASTSSTTSGSYSDNGPHVDHSSLGDSYSQSSVHDSYDSHPAMELHIH